jgi:tyrosyl-tRNA synthetase
VSQEFTTTRPIDLSCLARTTEQVFSLEELRKKLAPGRPLRVKYGVDVTAPFLHIGHAVNLWMMRLFQEHGHKVLFLIGDFTTRIGDPSGRSQTRRAIPDGEIKRNADEFTRQVGRVLLTDSSVFEVRRNSEWYDRMSTGEFMTLLAMVTHSHLIQRDMFQSRIARGREIYAHELLYPVLQGYDSVMLKSDLTIVGTDQLFNEMMGRFYQEKLGQETQVVITTKITPGTDGAAKQSKSLGNYIALEDSPRDKFGKVMSIPDDLIVPYLEVYTQVPLNEVEEIRSALRDGSLNPRDAKLRLAEAVVSRYHGDDQALAEGRWFREVFSGRQVPSDVPTFSCAASAQVIDILKSCLPSESRSALRRLVEQGAVWIGERRMDNPLARVTVNDGDIIQVGKRRWYKARVQ